MLIGVISDTRHVASEAVEALRGSEYIIHAGDIGNPAILGQLSAIAAVTALRGSVDTDGWARDIPQTNVLEVGGLAVYVLHNIDELDLEPEAAGFAAVIYGHSHTARHELRNGVLYFNPGSAPPGRFRLPVSLGMLEVRQKKLAARIIELPG
jgi:putative phosphoesterase